MIFEFRHRKQEQFKIKNNNRNNQMKPNNLDNYEIFESKDSILFSLFFFF